MRRWFLSYTSHDFALTQSLAAGLKRNDADAHIFFAPERMRAGGFWKEQLAKEIEGSSAFILLVGEKGLGYWQVMEYYEALDRRAKEPDYPIILILSANGPAPGLPFARQLHWVLTEDPASEATIGKLLDAASGATQRPGELWRFTRPYRGLEAMTEANSDYFFGRDRKTVEVIDALASEPCKLPILLGNSGVGKSSLAQAGLVASLLRQGWSERSKDAGSWPQAFHNSRRWCFLTLRPGRQPLQALVALFFDTWQYTAASSERVREERGWIELLRDNEAGLPDLLNATERRYKELAQTAPPAFFLYIDQGEELYVRAEQRERRRFSEILAHGLGDQRLHALMSMRSDFLGELQKDHALFEVRRQIDVPPLGEPELREVVSRPAELLSARFETDYLAADIARRTAEESTEDAGALPLLSYLLDDMWNAMVAQGDGVLRLPRAAMELGGVLAERANAFLARNPHSEDALRRVLTLRLATVREEGEPTRRRAARSEFTYEEWRLVSELADHPNRLLVTATPEGGDTYAEVAHEAIFRRWNKLREWIAAEREFLAWRTGLEAARRAWQATPAGSKADALLMGAALTQAESWFARRRDDLPTVDREFIDQSAQRVAKARARAWRVQALVYLLLIGIIIGLIGVINQAYVKERVNWYLTMRPYRVANFDSYVLMPEAEQVLKPGEAFRECAKDCPEMIVVPAGEFTMGSPANETGRNNNESPQRRVTIARPFAVSKFEVTFADWDACVSVGGCPHEGRAGDAGWGRDRQPLIYVSWDDARAYLAWLSRMTGKAYRLLTEAEWEYAARAGTTSAYFWGDEIGKGHANCNDCGSKWDGRQTAPVGSFAANAFGLHDLHGNVWEWVEDCFHDDYKGAPVDGSAWTAGDCKYRVVRGGSWYGVPRYLRSANRNGGTSDDRVDGLGFRVGRTLFAGADAITVAPGAH
jgi:formylglycine-generating enzyme required for sulfatase activity